MSGGGLFNNLDYSFSLGHEEGNDTSNKAPGGGSAALRKHLKVLGGFLRSLDFVHLKPDADSVKSSPGVVTRVLSDHSFSYAIYCLGRGPTALTVELAQGSWKADWMDPLTGEVLNSERFAHRHGLKVLNSPPFKEEAALRLVRK